MSAGMDRFAELNSATKYPSIETYHVLGEKGMLTEELGPFKNVGPDETVYATEKVDGTNGRIVFMGMAKGDVDYFIGSREELLYARGDRVKNPALSIVPTLAPVAEHMIRYLGYRPVPDRIVTMYFEVYGGKVGAQAKQYSRQGNVGHRLFDVSLADYEVLDQSREEISRWRDGGGQYFLELGALKDTAYRFGLETVPYLTPCAGEDLPKSVEEMAEYLSSEIDETYVGLDGTTDWTGKPEGLVFRTGDRRRIAKARFQDYERTLKRRSQKKG